MKHKFNKPDVINKLLAKIIRVGTSKESGLPQAEIETELYNIIIPFLSDKPHLEFKIPKPDLSLLYDVLSIMAQHIRFNGANEIEVFLIYNKNLNSYSTFVPKQNVAPASISYNKNISGDNILVVDFHLHPFGNNQAHFSGVDNHDDSDNIKISAVVGLADGQMNLVYPERQISFILNIFHRKVPITLDEIFELSPPMNIVENVEAMTLLRRSGHDVTSAKHTIYSPYYSSKCDFDDPYIDELDELDELDDFKGPVKVEKFEVHNKTRK